VPRVIHPDTKPAELSREFLMRARVRVHDSASRAGARRRWRSGSDDEHRAGDDSEPPIRLGFFTWGYRRQGS